MWRYNNIVGNYYDSTHTDSIWSQAQSLLQPEDKFSLKSGWSNWDNWSNQEGGNLFRVQDFSTMTDIYVNLWTHLQQVWPLKMVGPGLMTDYSTKVIYSRPKEDFDFEDDRHMWGEERGGEKQQDSEVIRSKKMH